MTTPCTAVFAHRGSNAPRSCILDHGHAGPHKDGTYRDRCTCHWFKCSCGANREQKR